MEVIDVHFLNAPTPICSTESGRQISESAVQPEKADSDIFLVDPSKVTLFKEAHPEKAEVGTTVSLLGIFTEVRFTQFSNALLPSFERVDGSSINLRDILEKNALSPMLVKVFGKETLCNAVQ